MLPAGLQRPCPGVHEQATRTAGHAASTTPGREQTSREDQVPSGDRTMGHKRIIVLSLHMYPAIKLQVLDRSSTLTHFGDPACRGT